MRNGSEAFRNEIAGINWDFALIYSKIIKRFRKDMTKENWDIYNSIRNKMFDGGRGSNVVFHWSDWEILDVFSEIV